MNKNKKVITGILIFALTCLFMGAIFQKSEAELAVIKAGVDADGNPVCINKSKVYLFKNFRHRIRLSFYIMTQLIKSICDQIFSGSEALDKYWESLLKNW